MSARTRVRHHDDAFPYIHHSLNVDRIDQAKTVNPKMSAGAVAQALQDEGRIVFEDKPPDMARYTSFASRTTSFGRSGSDLGRDKKMLGSADVRPVLARLPIVRSRRIRLGF